jgi:hypothetical protein
MKIVSISAFIFKFISSIKNDICGSDVSINKNSGWGIEDKVIAAAAK